MNIKADVPITLNSSSVADEYEGDLSARRTITWTLDFTLKGWIYPNITSGDVIKTIEVNFRIPGGDTDIETAEFIIFEDSTPDTTNYIILDGFDEGVAYRTFSRARIVNESTTDGVQDATIKSRVTIQPSPLSATANTDYGFSETFEFFNEGRHNDPTTGGDITS